MYNNIKCAVIYKRNFEGVSGIVRKIRIREYVQTESFCCTRVKRNYVRFLLTKKP